MIEESESMSRSVEQPPTVDQLLDAEIRSQMNFFRSVDAAKRKLGEDEVEVVDLLVLKRALRQWIQAALRSSLRE